MACTSAIDGSSGGAAVEGLAGARVARLGPNAEARAASEMQAGGLISHDRMSALTSSRVKVSMSGNVQPVAVAISPYSASKSTALTGWALPPAGGPHSSASPGR